MCEHRDLHAYTNWMKYGLGQITGTSLSIRLLEAGGRSLIYIITEPLRMRSLQRQRKEVLHNEQTLAMCVCRIII